MSNASITTSPPRASQGFSLFEVLVTVVVVGIGLLGLAGLQFAGLRASNNAQDATYATQLAQEVAERMRANRPAVMNGAYSGFSIMANNLLTTDPGCMTKVCTFLEMVQYDRYQMGRRIYPGNYLGGNVPILAPNPEIVVTNPTGDNRNFLITVSWGDPQNGDEQHNVQLPITIR